ncbi:spondin domain-containing protein [Candidatus Palauibacter soopunensis]|uniref:spondin domain-containing protein n=1 Tax=Candidatus Palauibacter soopunensis TaxID=3056739 RepID=UPI002397098B|nr:spondin domain-containing protein [Candidatus Palauibacter soopunensis]MDE2877532.1 spondin domain-containing protein [Candidatus Palauibacter soopunensis]
MTTMFPRFLKTRMAPLGLAVSVAVMAACDGSETAGVVTPDPEPEPPPPVAATTARYRVVFEATWSASTHPTNFPGGAHFSPLIGAVHNAGVTFWARDGTATPGIETMAETGGTSTLTAEIQAQIPGGALAVVNGSGIRSPGSTTIQAIALRADFPLVTLVTMIAPSPDWFVGVSGLSLRDADGNWIEELEVVLYPYDAGTDSGPVYTSANNDTQPKEPIRNLRGESPFSDEPIGTFTFTRTDG